MIKCDVCGKEFIPNPKYRQGIQKHCSKNCQAKYWKDNNPDKAANAHKNWIDRNPEKRQLIQRKAQLKRKYGITLEEYDVLLEAQGGVCAICGEKKSETLAVDHNHKTGKVRGLLCAHCNHVVGFARDDISLLTKAIEYLTS